MCFFLTLGIPRQRALPDFAFGRGFELAPTENPTILAGFPAGYTAMLVTSGMCSCGLYAPPRATSSREEHLRRKYAKRGWSEAKIQRAVTQSQSAHPGPSAWSGLRLDLVDALRLTCERAGALAVVVHWYNGDIESERFTLTNTRKCALDELPALAARFAEDEIVLVSSTSD